MRKENVSRLLLTLLTAFVMVAGVFGAAIQTWSFTAPSGEMNDQIVDSVPDMANGGTGDAPVSATDSETLTSWSTINSDDDRIDEYGRLVDDIGPEPGDVLTDPMDMDYPYNGVDDISDSLVEPHGTRAATLDAGGPYGEMPPGIPYLEGESVDFEADIIGGSTSDYYFRWNVDSYSDYEVNHFPAAYGGDNTKGVSDYTHDYLDNMYGQGTVEAWDGTSYKTTYLDGQPLENAPVYTYWYRYANPLTMGWQFTTSEEIIVDELFFYDWYYPYYLYYIDIWDTSTMSKVATTGYLNVYTTNYLWNSFDIAPVTLPAGSYVVSAYVSSHSYGLFPYTREVPDDDIVTSGNVRYRHGSGNLYPSGSISSGNYPMVTFHYEYAIQEPDLLEANCDIFVDNIAPVAQNAVTIGGAGQEGTELGFTAEFYDIGLDDDWWYQWDFGDGETSPWIKVNKWNGGVKTLFLHTYSGQIGSIIAGYNAAMGPAAVLTEEYDCGPLGNNNAPDLDYMLQFDVIIIGSNYIPSPAVGNVLDDYAAAGGGVVELVAMMHPTYGIGGDWRSEGYSVFPTSSALASVSNPVIYDPTHPIIDGIAGTATSWSCTLAIGLYSITPGAVLLADYSSGAKAVAYRNEDNIVPGSGRVVGINVFAQSGYWSGQFMELLANAAMWASQETLPTIKPMPIALEPTYHVYADDHPTHVTPEDTFNVVVEVKDDDHGKVVGGAGVDWSKNLAWDGVPLATPSHNGGGVGVWGVDRLNNGDKIGTYNDCWTQGNGGTNNWNEYEWPTAQTISGMTAYYTRYRVLNGYTLHATQIQWWDGSSWVNDVYYDDMDHGNSFRDAFIELSAPVTTTRIRTADMKTFGGNSNIMIQEWEIHPALPGGDSYEMNGLSNPVTTTALIKNVFPYCTFPDELPDVVNEQTPILFEDLDVNDIAFRSGTEDMWYRIDTDDGTGVGDWNRLPTGGSGPINLLIYHSFDATDTNAISFRTNLMPYLPPGSTADIWNFFGTAAGPAPLSVLEMYDVIFVGTQLAPFDGDAVGDGLADYVDGGGAVVETSAGVHSTSGWWGVAGRWRSEGYQTLQPSGSLYSSIGATILDPSHPIADGPAGAVTSFTARICLGSPGATADATLLAEGGGFAMAAYHNDLPSVAINTLYYPGYYTSTETILVANAIIYAAYGGKQPIPAFEHTYQDNGIYYFDVQAIDDDMWWDWGPTDTQPTFVGPNNDPNNPGADPADWISHNIHPIEVYNTDPVITPRIEAYAEVELSIRTTGQPNEDVEMRLYKGSTLLGSVTCFHDGNEKIKVLSGVAFDMTEINDYHVEVEYFGTGGGANPTWIFSGHFPSGKVKELKHEFKDGDPVWIIGADMLIDMIRGEDIIFEATAYDYGSDDLAFVWNFGDTSPLGVHIYANADREVHVGVSDEATVIFNQDPHRDPWFDKSGNTERSPYGTSILVKDTIVHRFDESQQEYFYVGLTVMDDDVKEDYPSTQLHGTPGLDYSHVEIDFS